MRKARDCLVGESERKVGFVTHHGYSERARCKRARQRDVAALGKHNIGIQFFEQFFCARDRAREQVRDLERGQLGRAVELDRIHRIKVNTVQFGETTLYAVGAAEITDVGKIYLKAWQKGDARHHMPGAPSSGQNDFHMLLR